LLEATLLPWLQPRLGGRVRIRNARHPRVIELHDDGVRCVSAAYDIDRPWAMVERVVELPGQYLLLVGGRHYVSVPTEDLSADQLNDLRALLARLAPAVAS
jgi:YcxB-like protein